MRIGIDCDGVLRDFIPDLINKIKETHPEHADKIGIPHSWDWEDWLHFGPKMKLKNLFLKILM